MKTMMGYWLMLTALIAILTIVFKMISQKTIQSHQKSSTFECGFDPLTSLRLPFSMNFFVISIIFLVFDVELILLLPLIFLMKMEQTKMILWITILFFSILILGFVYEWWMGLLKWLV